MSGGVDRGGSGSQTFGAGEKQAEKLTLRRKVELMASQGWCERDRAVARAILDEEAADCVFLVWHFAYEQSDVLAAYRSREAAEARAEREGNCGVLEMGITDA